MKINIIIDAQNDFIDGVLGTPEAKVAIEYTKIFFDKAVENNEYIIFTQDTHRKDYLETFEGKRLPVKHCDISTAGWNLHKYFRHYVSPRLSDFIQKPTFGSYELIEKIKQFNEEITEIKVCGFCTDICVISNVLMLRAAFPSTKISVYAKACAGSTPENHQAAIKVMKACQIDMMDDENE